MHKMKTYKRVSMFDIELAIENEIGETAEATEIENLCRETMKVKPVPFAHTADMLHARGYSNIVYSILDAIDDR